MLPSRQRTVDFAYGGPIKTGGEAVGVAEQEEYDPLTLTQLAVGVAHTVRVPKAAPHRSPDEAVVITIVVAEADDCQTPVPVCTVVGAGVEVEVNAGKRKTIRL